MLAFAGAVLAVARRRTAGGQPANSRTARNMMVAGVGARLGAEQVAHQARRTFASAARREVLDAEHELRTAEQVAETLGHMKGALMKLGQMASFLDEGMPEPVREALSSLQQDAPPMSGDLAAEVVERELGRGPEDVFAEWDPVPIAAASIGQVHRAMTQDGRAVAVKVQYPGVDEAIAADLDNSDLLFGILGMVFPGLDPKPLVAELRDRLTEEIDYRQEARNQQLFCDFYAGHPFIAVPAVVGELSAGRVLTTELAEGARFAEVKTWPQEERDLAGETIYRFVFRSLYRMRAFNGDPHPGNYLFRPGGRVTFLDFGLVKHYEPAEIATFEAMIRTFVLQPDPAAFRTVIERAGLLLPDAPITDQQVSEYFGHFYDIVRQDQVTTFTPAYASEMIRRLFGARNDYGGLPKWANLPPPFVILQRINLGLMAVLADLRATANWRRVAEELWPITSAPPSTPLGREEAPWLATRT